MKKLFKRLNIKIKEIKYYAIAFSHSSYVNEHHLKSDYERLEFLGDTVVDLAISDYLYSNEELEEGQMTKIRASYVCENALYEYAKDLGLGDYLRLGSGEDKDGGRFKKVILADTFEALMGAIYLDLGFETAKRVILDIIVPYIEDEKINFFSDYKSALQETIVQEQKNLEYVLVKELGESHSKTFIMEAVIDGIVYGRGEASSKKEAEQAAAKDALDKLVVKL